MTKSTTGSNTHQRTLRRAWALLSAAPTISVMVAAATSCDDGAVGGAPVDLVAQPLSPNAIEVRWRPVIDDAPHRVYFATSPAELGAMSLAARAGRTSTVVDGLQPRTTYFFTATSIQPVVGESERSAVVSATTPLGPLRAPFDLRPVAVAPTSIQIQWDTDDDTTESFIVEARRPPRPFEPVLTAGPIQRTATIEPLEISTRYVFRVRAMRGATLSGFSNTATISTTSPPGIGVEKVFPASGSTNGSYPVIVEGWGFTDSPPTITFGEREALEVIVVNDTRVSCLAPIGPPGPAAVRVENADMIGTSSATFTYTGLTDSALTIDLRPEPVVSFDRAIGVTTVLMAFMVRDIDGFPVPASDLTTRMFVDDAELGVDNRFNESVLTEESDELEQSVFLFLTLDASYSLVTQFNPEQFTPMLQRAIELIDGGIDIWGASRDEAKIGEFFWDVAWFRELIETSTVTLAPEQLAAIPPPEAGDETKMRAAVSYQIEASTDAYRAQVARGRLDRHFVVVFTDGQDTLSWFDNEATFDGTLALDDGTPAIRFGWRSVELEDLFDEIVRHPMYPEQFSVFAVGLGRGVDQRPLRQIAQVGLGRFFFEQSNLGNLFDRLSAEINDQLTRGATLAVRPGDYTFRVEVTRVSTQETAEQSFDFRVTDADAVFISLR